MKQRKVFEVLKSSNATEETSDGQSLKVKQILTIQTQSDNKPWVYQRRKHQSNYSGMSNHKEQSGSILTHMRQKRPVTGARPQTTRNT